jgi:peptidoglycan/xylan/chitin deacetylase (PgdA/CDA1 family)
MIERSSAMANILNASDRVFQRGLLGLYYYGSQPYRRIRNALQSRAGHAPLISLFYHRVADDRANAWTCPFDLFARQMRWLKANFDLVSLAELQTRIRRGANHRPAVSITFDDGYADNCRQALPLLIAERIPCTYFVTTRHVFEGIPFPHDVARGDHFAPNTIGQLRELAAAGVEIGAHTRTHADLGQLTDSERLLDEVVTAGEELAAALGRPVRYFAFPYGLHANLNAEAFRLAREAGYAGVCSAYGGYNFPGDDAFHIQRIHGDADLLRFKNWLLIDPRKLSVSRYRYEQASQPRHAQEAAAV